MPHARTVRVVREGAASVPNPTRTSAPSVGRKRRSVVDVSYRSLHNSGLAIWVGVWIHVYDVHMCVQDNMV